MENKYELYKKLLNMDGIPGHERQVKKFVKEELQKYTDTILEDVLIEQVFITTKPITSWMEIMLILSV